MKTLMVGEQSTVDNIREETSITIALPVCPVNSDKSSLPEEYVIEHGSLYTYKWALGFGDSDDNKIQASQGKIRHGSKNWNYASR